MDCPRAVIFDLDDTLAESFKRPSDEMLNKLKALMAIRPVSIMTGAGFPRMHDHFLPVLEKAIGIANFYLFPTSASQCYVFRDGAWQRLYQITLSEEERAAVKEALEKSVEEHDELRSIPTHGKQLFDRDSQVAFTLVGVDAPKELKDSWDSDGAKRRLLQRDVEKSCPTCEVLLGGRTTIDVTKKGINKAYGVTWLAKELNVPVDEMLYIGDAFFEGGNDRIVIPTGIKTREVTGPEQTAVVIDELLNAGT